MGNISSIFVYLRNVTDRLCCRALETNYDVEKSGTYFLPSNDKIITKTFSETEQPKAVCGQSSFYIASTTTIYQSPVLTPQSSIATTISNSSSDIEIQNWCEIDLNEPRVYRPLSTPIKDSEIFRRFRGDINDRGTIIFIPEDHQANESQRNKEVPGVHNSEDQKRTLWTKTMNRLRGSRRQMLIQNYLAKHKSDEVHAADLKIDIETGPSEVSRVRNGVIESDL